MDVVLYVLRVDSCYSKTTTMLDCQVEVNRLWQWLTLSFQHKTVHMAADLKQCDHIYIGNADQEASVLSISKLFNPNSDTVLECTIEWQHKPGTSEAIFTMQNGHVYVTTNETYSDWGIKGHSRNTIVPLQSTNDVSFATY